MTTIVALPDGREVEFPDGTPREEMERAMRDFMAAGAPPPADLADAVAGNPAPSGETTALGIGGNLAEGINEGIATVLGAPVDLVNMAPMLLNLLPGDQGMTPISDDPVGGGEFFRGLMGDAGFTGNFEPDTRPERIVRRVGEEVGATALPVAGATLRGANLAARGISPAEMALLDRAIAGPAQRAPVRNVIDEGLTAAGAGAGAQVLKEEFNGSPTAEMIGNLLGGAGTAAATNTVENAVRMGASVAPGATGRMAREEVGRQLVEAANNPDVLGPGSGARAADAPVEGLNPTLSQATGDLGIEALENSRRGGPNSGRFAERGAEQNRALQDAVDEVAPGGVGDEVARSIMADAEAQAQREFDEAREVALTEARKRVAERAAGVEQADAETAATRAAADPGATKEVSSRAAAERVTGEGPDAAIQRFRAKRNELYGQVPEDVKVPSEGARATAREIVDKSGRAGSPPREISRIAGAPDNTEVDEAAALLREVFGDEIPDEIEQITFGQAKDDLTVLGDAARAARKEGRFGDARKIEQVRDAVRADMESAESASDALAAANRYEREVYAPRFREGAAYDVTRGKTPPNEYLDKVVSDPNEADRFIKTVEGDEKAMSAARDFMLADLTRDGADNLNAAKVSKWLKRNEEVLERFPEVRSEVEGIRDRMKAGADGAAKARADLKAAEADAAEIERWTPPKRDEAIKLYSDEETAQEGVAALLRGKNSARNVSRIMNLTEGSNEAQDAIKRGFVEFFKRKTRGASQDVEGAFLTRPKAMRDFLDDYGRQMRVIFRDSPEHLKRFEEIVESVTKVNDLASQAPLSKVNRRGDRITLGGVPLTSVMSRVFAAESGRTSYRFVVSEGLAQVFTRIRQSANGPALDALLDEALMDPKLAEVLASTYNKANDRRATRTLSAAATRIAARTARGAATSGDDESDE